MALQQGSRGEEVRKMQQALLDAGFDPGPIDGIFGPKTASAVKAYQSSQSMVVNGVYDDYVKGFLEGDPAVEGTTQDGVAGDQTDDPTTRFVGLPGNATELWRNEETGEIYAVFFVPDTDPPVPLLMTVPNEEVAKTYFKDGVVVYDRTTNSSGFTKSGAVWWGDVADIPIEKKNGDPWSGFLQKMERAKEVMPWLEDPDVWNIIAGAYLEGRPVEEWELATTEWFRSKTEAERAWMTKVAQDPSTALQVTQDNKIAMYDYFEGKGFTDIDPGLVDYITNQWTTGAWSAKYAERQIDKLAGGGENYALDPDLQNFMTENDVEVTDATVGLAKVETMWRDWLGPLYAPSEAEIQRWAGILRDDSVGGEARLTEHLRSQRMALYPEYADSTLMWRDIVAPWKSLATQTWGVPVDETDTAFINIVKMNDPNAAQQAMREIGFERGYEAIYEEMIRGIDQGINRSVRGPV
jgi:peptidoglycan hydrolase-like protein with peptidoglycan-binding domain